MSTVTSPVILDATGQAIASGIDRIADAINGSGGVVYGFHIDGGESDGSEKVTYLRDAVGMTPAAMNFSSGVFDYGSWEDAFFMPRPCMLKSDGTVDYYLNPNDYTKKESGAASDVANTSYDGNAMIEWGQNGKKIWYKVVPSGDGKSGSVYIADHKDDEGYHDYSFHNCKGQSVAHFYTPIYNGSVISSKMRSLSGQVVSKNLSGTAEITAAKANNAGSDELWSIECLADRTLIDFLLILMGKSTNTQAVFGQGLVSNGTEAINDGFTTGVHNTKGLFYGTSSGAANTYTNAVKVFGMENYWGFQNRRTNGLIMASGVQKIKLTYGKEDGSNVEGYNTDGADYISIGVTPTGTSGGYCDEMHFNDKGMFSKSANGDSTHNYCDAFSFDTTITAFARFGGYSSGGARAGAFYCDQHRAVSDANWHIGAAVSCKPVA